MHPLGARLQARTVNRDEWRGGDRVLSADQSKRRVGEQDEREMQGAKGGEAQVFSLKLTVFSEEDGCIISAEK